MPKTAFTIKRLGSYALLAEQLINFNELGHMPFKEDDGISLDLKQKWAKYHAGLVI